MRAVARLRLGDLKSFAVAGWSHIAAGSLSPRCCSPRCCVRAHAAADGSNRALQGPVLSSITWQRTVGTRPLLRQRSCKGTGALPAELARLAKLCKALELASLPPWSKLAKLGPRTRAATRLRRASYFSLLASCFLLLTSYFLSLPIPLPHS